MQPLDTIEDHASGETPEDVAILYSWANLEGAKYRDFSANRREYRAQMRHRAAEQLRLMELRAQSEAEAAAVEAEAEAAAAHAEADAATVKLAASRTMQASGLMKAASGPEELEAEEQVERMRRSSLREAAQQARRAAAERLEAARRAEAAALADSIARREEREIAEAQASALRQAAQYAESEVRGRQKKAMQPENTVPGRISDPYGPQVVAEGEYFERPGTPVSELEASRFRHQREYIEHNTGAELPHFRMPEASQQMSHVPEQDAAPSQRQRGYQPDEPSGHRPGFADESQTGKSFEEHPIDGTHRLEPRRQARPVYEERHLSIARDAHRLDEAGALQLRREQKKAADAREGDAALQPGPQARMVVPSIPYKEFRRVTGNATQSVMPDVLGRIPNPPQEESGWRVAESSVGSGHSHFREEEPGGYEPQRGVYPAAEHPAIHAGPPAGRPRSDDPPMPRRDEKPVREDFDSHRSLNQQRTEQGSDLRPEGNADAKSPANGAPAKANSLPSRDSWGVAWSQPDPRVKDTQPTWSNRPQPASPQPQPAAPPNPPPHLPPDASGPAWLYASPPGPRFVDSLVDSHARRAGLAVQSLKAGSGQTQNQSARDGAAARTAPVEHTLQHSREQVASRWFALKGVFAKADRDHRNEQHPVRDKKRNTPFTVVYSVAGGVGKTSLVATLGRTLSSLGEKVLLTDTSSQGLLPFYFGASELHPGVVRTFSPPSGSTDAPIHLVSYDFAGQQKGSSNSDSETHRGLFEELVANSQQANRVLMDMNANCGWMLAKMAWMKPTILVPLAADMNSVISLQAVERSFQGLQDAEGKPLQPTYLLNHFDASLPLHLDVREVLKQQLGARLLPFVVRRAGSVSEALAEGMTIVDYDPESEAAKDFMGVANWLRNASAPATVGFRNLRWSER